jgi:hypothetical protein
LPEARLSSAGAGAQAPPLLLADLEIRDDCGHSCLLVRCVDDAEMVAAPPQGRSAPRNELRGTGFLPGRWYAAEVAAAAAIQSPELLAFAYRIDMTIGMRIRSIRIMTGQKTRPSTSPLNFSQRFIF